MPPLVSGSSTSSNPPSPLEARWIPSASCHATHVVPCESIATLVVGGAGPVPASVSSPPAPADGATSSTDHEPNRPVASDTPEVVENDDRRRVTRRGERRASGGTGRDDLRGPRVTLRVCCDHVARDRVGHDDERFAADESHLGGRRTSLGCTARVSSTGVIVQPSSAPLGDPDLGLGSANRVGDDRRTGAVQRDRRRAALWGLLHGFDHERRRAHAVEHADVRRPRGMDIGTGDRDVGPRRVLGRERGERRLRGRLEGDGNPAGRLSGLGDRAAGPDLVRRHAREQDRARIVIRPRW